MNILAVVPARAGSKGLFQKNAQTINGESLTMRTLRLAKQFTPYVILTSDMNIVLEQAAYAGFPVHLPIEPWRGVTIHSDTCRAWDVWRECVEYYENFMTINDWPKKFDGHVYLEVTSPCRIIEDLQGIPAMLEHFDSIATVSRVDPSDSALKQLMLDATGKVVLGFQEDVNNPPRQSLAPTWKRNGIFYACTDKFLKESDSIVKLGVTVAHAIAREVINIDTQEDLDKARRMLK